MGRRIGIFLVWVVVLWHPVAWGGAYEEPVKLGFVYILSGSYGTYGRFAREGAMLAIDEINAKGGIMGLPVAAIFEDSRSKPDVALAAIRKLVLEDRVDCLIGIDSSNVARAVAPHIAELKTPLIVTNAATPDITGPLCNRYLFRISLNLAQHVKSAALLAVQTGAKTWTTIGKKHTYSYQSWDYFTRYLKTLKPDAITVPKEKAVFIPSKTKDFGPYINQAAMSGARGILVTLWQKDLMNFMVQAHEAGLFSGGIDVLSTMGANMDVLSGLGDRMPTGVWVSSAYWFLANDSRRNREFTNRYHQRYRAYPTYNAHNAFGAVHAFRAAVERAGSPDKEAVVSGLEGLTLELPIGYITIRREDHQAAVDACWGKTHIDPRYPFRILEPKRIFKGESLMQTVAETGCR